MKSNQQITHYFKYIFSVIFFLFFTQVSLAVPVSPDKYFIDAKIGEEYTNEIILYGPAEEGRTEKLYLTPVGMKKVGEEADREFYLPDPQNQAEPANWIKLERNEVELKSGELAKVKWTIKPSDLASCGTNLAAIMVYDREMDLTKNEGANVLFAKEVMSQIHVNISKVQSGPCLNMLMTLGLQEFKLDNRNGYFGTSIYNYDAEIFVAKIRNNSDVIARNPRGYIEVFGLGDKITIPFNSQKVDVYPNSVRTFDEYWIDPNYPRTGGFLEKFLYEISHLRFGQYTARLGVTSNVDRQIVSEVSFWIIPWRVVSVFIAIIVMILIFFKQKEVIKFLKGLRIKRKRPKKQEEILTK